MAVVTEVRDQKILVKSEIKSACSGCQQVDSCASGQVAKAIPHRKLSLYLENKGAALDNTLALNVGDKVIIGIVEKELLQTAFQVYLWPLLGLIIFSGFGQYQVSQGVFSHELIALFLGVIGAGLGFIIAKTRLAKLTKTKSLAPQLLRKACPTSSVTE